MSAPVPRPKGLPGGVPLVPSHATEEDYRAFLHTRGYRKGPFNNCLRARRRFVEAYPELADWFAAPMEVRVGSLYGSSYKNAYRKARARVSMLARSYLYFLALSGRVRFDWEWLVAVHQLNLKAWLEMVGLRVEADELIGEARALGYADCSARVAVDWTVGRLFLRTLKTSVRLFTEEDLEEARRAALSFRDRPDAEVIFGSAERCHKSTGRLHSYLHLFGVLLYHRGQIPSEPSRTRPCALPEPSRKPRMEAIAKRYLDARRVNGARSTVDTIARALRSFIAWSLEAHPEVESFAELTRDHACEYAAYLGAVISKRTGRPLGVVTQRTMLGSLAVFFRDTAAWEWEDAPRRPLMLPGDRPKQPRRIPRYIPDSGLRND